MSEMAHLVSTSILSVTACLASLLYVESHPEKWTEVIEVVISLWHVDTHD